MKKSFLKSSDITDIALLAALLTVAGAIKLPSLLPGLEFQISAPLAVAICFVFGFKKYILVGILSSAISLALGTHNLFNVAIAMLFRLMVGVVLGKGVWALVAAALPGMVFTFVTAPFMVKLLQRISQSRHAIVQ